MTQNKEVLRRTKVFSALDAMKESGEKATAQKLAAAVSMGKQTVLPLYREWQELEVLGDSADVSLSPELLRALKRELARDKFRQSELQRELEESMEDQRISFDETITKLTQEVEQLTVQLQSLENKNESLKQQQDVQQEQNTEQRAVIRELNSKQVHAISQIETAEAKLQASESGKERALQEQEKRLDEANQKLLNHWMGVVDSERREKERLFKQLERERENCARTERELVETRQEANRLDSSLEKNNAERIATEKHNKSLQEQAIITDALSLMLGHPQDLTTSIKMLLKEAKTAELHRHKNQTIEQALNKANTKLATFKQLESSNHQLEKEVIRLQAYADGLQAATKGNRQSPQKQKA